MAQYVGTILIHLRDTSPSSEAIDAAEPCLSPPTSEERPPAANPNPELSKMPIWNEDRD